MPQYNGRYFRDLEKSVQRRLKSKALRAVCLDKDSQELKYEIFSRLNLGAVKLKDQELRNCIYRGPFNDMLKDIASNNQVLKLLFHDDNMHSAYEERILRFFALRNYLETQGTFKVTMNRYMAKHQFDSETELQKMKTKYNGLIDLIKQVLGENAFYSLSNNQRKQFNGAVYDSIAVSYTHLDVYKRQVKLWLSDTIARASKARSPSYIALNSAVLSAQLVAPYETFSTLHPR